MRLRYVHHEKRSLISVLVVEFVQGGNLPPKWWSGVTAEDHDYGLLGIDLRKADGLGFVEFG